MKQRVYCLSYCLK